MVRPTAVRRSLLHRGQYLVSSVCRSSAVSYCSWPTVETEQELRGPHFLANMDYSRQEQYAWDMLQTGRLNEPCSNLCQLKESRAVHPLQPRQPSGPFLVVGGHCTDIHWTSSPPKYQTWREAEAALGGCDPACITAAGSAQGTTWVWDVTGRLARPSRRLIHGAVPKPAAPPSSGNSSSILSVGTFGGQSILERCLVGAYDLRSLDLTAAALRDSQEDKVVLVDLPAGGPKKPWGLPRGMGDSRGLIGSGNAGAPHPEAWRTNGVACLDGYVNPLAGDRPTSPCSGMRSVADARLSALLHSRSSGIRSRFYAGNPRTRLPRHVTMWSNAAADVANSDQLLQPTEDHELEVSRRRWALSKLRHRHSSSSRSTSPFAAMAGSSSSPELPTRSHSRSSRCCSALQRCKLELLEHTNSTRLSRSTSISASLKRIDSITTMLHRSTSSSALLASTSTSTDSVLVADLADLTLLPTVRMSSSSSASSPHNSQPGSPADCFSSSSPSSSINSFSSLVLLGSPCCSPQASFDVDSTALLPAHCDDPACGAVDATATITIIKAAPGPKATKVVEEPSAAAAGPSCSTANSTADEDASIIPTASFMESAEARTASPAEQQQAPAVVTSPIPPASSSSAASPAAGPAFKHTAPARTGGPKRQAEQAASRNRGTAAAGSRTGSRGTSSRGVGSSATSSQGSSKGMSGHSPAPRAARGPKTGGQPSTATNTRATNAAGKNSAAPATGVAKCVTSTKPQAASDQTDAPSRPSTARQSARRIAFGRAFCS